MLAEIGSLVSRTFGSGSRSNNAPQLIEGPDFYRRFGVPAAPGVQQQLQSYDSWVYAAVSLIAARTADMKLRMVLETGDDKPTAVKNHPFLKMLRKPNPFTGRYEFMYMHQMFMDLTGNSFWYIVNDRANIPREMWLLPPDRVAPVPDKDKFIAGYLYTPPGEGAPIAFSIEEIAHFKYPSPVDFYRGWSPLRAAAYAYDINLYTHVYERSFFKEGARFDFALQTDSDMTEEQVTRLYKMWNKSHQGVDKAWRPAILTGGIKAVPLNQMNKDFEFANLAAWTKDEILGIYKVPEAMLGHAKDVNKASADALEVIFTRNSILPRIRQTEEVLESNLLPRYPGQTDTRHFDLEFDNPVPPDRDMELKEEEARLKNGVVTIDEVRSKIGMAETEWGKEPYLQEQMTPISKLKDKDLAPPPPPPAPIIAPPGTPVAPEPGTPAVVPKPGTPKPATPKKSFGRVGAGEMMQALERQLMPVIGTTLDSQMKRWIKLIQAAELKDAPIGEQRMPYIVERLLLKMEEEVHIFTVELLNAFVYIYTSAAKTIMSAYGLITGISMDNQHIVNFISSKILLAADRINSETRNLVRTSLLEGITANEIREQLIERIRTLFNGFRAERIGLIAQTEVVALVGNAATELYIANEYEYKEWGTQEDERVRDTHNAANGQVVPINEKFAVGGAMLDYPGDPKGPMKEIARCRCFPIPRRNQES